MISTKEMFSLLNHHHYQGPGDAERVIESLQVAAEGWRQDADRVSPAEAGRYRAWADKLDEVARSLAQSCERAEHLEIKYPYYAREEQNNDSGEM